MRIRIPGNCLTSYQMRAMAQIVYDNDYVDDELTKAGWPLRWQSFPAGAAFVQREARLGADKGGGAVDAILATLSLLRPVSNNADCGFEVQYSPLPRLRSAERH